MNETSIPVAAKAKYARVQEEAAQDPKFTYTAQQLLLSYGETALYLSVMDDPITGVAPLEYVKIISVCPLNRIEATKLIHGIEEEHLLYLEGWRPLTTETNIATLATMVVRLQR